MSLLSRDVLASIVEKRSGLKKAFNQRLITCYSRRRTIDSSDHLFYDIGIIESFPVLHLYLEHVENNSGVYWALKIG